MGEFYYNTHTQQVEEGRLSPGHQLMGPYETREQAQRAFEIAEQRNKQWEDEDREWHE